MNNCDAKLVQFASEVKQLCKDFSDLRDRPYMGDVTSAIGSLLVEFMKSDGCSACSEVEPYAD